MIHQTRQKLAHRRKRRVPPIKVRARVKLPITHVSTVVEPAKKRRKRKT